MYFLLDVSIRDDVRIQHLHYLLLNYVPIRRKRRRTKKGKIIEKKIWYSELLVTHSFNYWKDTIMCNNNNHRQERSGKNNRIFQICKKKNHDFIGIDSTLSIFIVFLNFFFFFLNRDSHRLSREKKSICI